MTKRYLAELIQRRFAGGDPGDDMGLTLQDIAGWLDFGIAAAAMKNYADTAQLDAEYIADGFYISYGGIALTRDTNTGYYVGSLPATPYAVPKGYDISGVYIQGEGKQSRALVRIMQNQIAYWKEYLRLPPNSIAFWIEGKQIFLDSQFVLDGKTITVRMAGGNDGNLDSQVNLPPDLVDFAVGLVLQKLMPFAGVRPDTSNDGIDVK